MNERLKLAKVQLADSSVRSLRKTFPDFNAHVVDGFASLELSRGPEGPKLIGSPDSLKIELRLTLT